MKKLLALLLAVCMVFGLMVPVTAYQSSDANAATDPEMLAEMATMKKNYIEFICGTAKFFHNPYNFVAVEVSLLLSTA